VSGAAVRRRGTAAGLRLQARVIHALILREIQTRFGRDGGGFLWLFVEPILLSCFIGLMKWAAERWTGSGHGINPFLFAIVGYVPFFGFRAILMRGASAIQANAALMYHRPVQLLDIIIARNVLEAVAVMGAVSIILTGVAWVLGDEPSSLLTMLLGMALLLLFANGLGMLVAAGCATSETFEKLIHPATYLTMPLSGCLFALHWMPAWIRDALLWNPQVHFHEMVRDGMFGNVLPAYYDVPYMLGAVLLVNFFGLCALRAVRSRVEL